MPIRARVRQPSRSRHRSSRENRWKPCAKKRGGGRVQRLLLSIGLLSQRGECALAACRLRWLFRLGKMSCARTWWPGARSADWKGRPRDELDLADPPGFSHGSGSSQVFPASRGEVFHVDRNSNKVEIQDTSSFQTSYVRLWPPGGPRIATLFPFNTNLPRFRTPGRSTEGKGSARGLANAPVGSPGRGSRSRLLDGRTLHAWPE